MIAGGIMSDFNALEHLQKVILPYWNSMKDTENGGFYGFKTFDLEVLKEADKGCILHSRILWFYSNVYLSTKDEEALKNATHAFEFIKNHCFDEINHGIYWMLDYKGGVKDDIKNAYNQAFCIYGLASYYRATKCEESMQLAFDLFMCLETYFKDDCGYLEAFSVDFKNPVESAICDQGVVADKTMNTLLHVLEAYTELLKAGNHPTVAVALMKCLKIAADKVYNPEFKRLETFFDAEMNSLADIHSYGHDIEATWLLDRAADVLEESLKTCKDLDLLISIDEAKAIIAKTREYTPIIAKRVLDVAFDGEALNNESREEIAESKGEGTEHVDTTRVWWVQAEAVVGFVNAYQISKDEKFLEAAKTIFNYIETVLTDKREDSEWFWAVDKKGKPEERGITEPWKCPYHNGRMCLELINRFHE